MLDDINPLEKTNDKDMLHVKGEMTRHNPTMTTTTMNAAIPKELQECNKDITLCVNVMCVNEMGFMTSTSHPTHHWGCKHIIDNAIEQFHGALDEMLQVHNEGRHRIKTIECDREFEELMEKVEDNLGMTMNHANAQDHVVVIEQNNWTTKEAIQAQFHRFRCNVKP